MKIIIRTNLIIGLTLISNLILGQNRIHKSYWSYNIHLTSTHFLSDLGGKNTRGSNDISSPFSFKLDVFECYLCVWFDGI